jgi:ATP phosphoribosyltransferase regulatory subunit
LSDKAVILPLTRLCLEKHGIPTISLPGVRDILPEEAARIGAAEAGILSVFERHGFRKVVTPLLEYVDVLSLGMGANLKDRVLKFIDPSTGRVVAIRPDITPQIARVAATRMRDHGLPMKLCYNESVLRYQEARDGKSREVLQIGAEYISEKASAGIDAEMIISIEALSGIGLRDFKIDIGDVGFLRAVLDKLPVDAESRGRIKDAIAIKDTSGLEAILSGLTVPDKDRQLLLNMTTFYGEEEVLEKAASFSRDPESLRALEYLREVVDIIARKGLKDRVTIDLGEVGASTTPGSYSKGSPQGSASRSSRGAGTTPFLPATATTRLQPVLPSTWRT